MKSKCNKINQKGSVFFLSFSYILYLFIFLLYIIFWFWKGTSAAPRWTEGVHRLTDAVLSLLIGCNVLCRHTEERLLMKERIYHHSLMFIFKSLYHVMCFWSHYSPQSNPNYLCRSLITNIRNTATTVTTNFSHIILLKSLDRQK